MTGTSFRIGVGRKKLNISMFCFFCEKIFGRVGHDWESSQFLSGPLRIQQWRISIFSIRVTFPNLSPLRRAHLGKHVSAFFYSCRIVGKCRTSCRSGVYSQPDFFRPASNRLSFRNCSAHPCKRTGYPCSLVQLIRRRYGATRHLRGSVNSAPELMS